MKGILSSSANFSIRPAQKEDRHGIANLIHFGQYIHRHLDWRSPLDWIEEQPFLLAEHEGRLLATLACPPDLPGLAWIRLFAASDGLHLERSWQDLWSFAHQQLIEKRVFAVVAIPLQSWFSSLLSKSRFTIINQVVILVWEGATLPSIDKCPEVNLRPMNFDDLPIIHEVDTQAFELTWRISRPSLEMAFRQSAFATVAELQNRIVGYQISTAAPSSGHLARLAVLPAFQGMRIGLCLVIDLLEQFIRRGIHHVTVNTQQDNQRSLSLYARAGFRRTKEAYPVYQYKLGQ